MSASTVAEVSASIPMMSAASALNVPATSKQPKPSVADYFAIESASEISYEYVDGDLIPMTGESLAHNRIALNFSIAFDRAFESCDCQVYMEGVRLRVSPTRYRYPDIVALCGTPVTDDENPPALLNPSVIVEVLSPSTQATDRGEKLEEYWHLSGLTDYLLAAQDKMSVFHYVRQSDSTWTATEYTDPNATLNFASLQVSFTLADVYRKVSFSVPEVNG